MSYYCFAQLFKLLLKLDLKTFRFGYCASRNQPAMHCFLNFAMILNAHIHILTSRNHKGDTTKSVSKQTLALRQASEESACFLLSFFCDD